MENDTQQQSLDEETTKLLLEFAEEKDASIDLLDTILVVEVTDGKVLEKDRGTDEVELLKKYNRQDVYFIEKRHMDDGEDHYVATRPEYDAEDGVASLRHD